MYNQMDTVITIVFNVWYYAVQQYCSKIFCLVFGIVQCNKDILMIILAFYDRLLLFMSGLYKLALFQTKRPRTCADMS